MQKLILILMPLILTITCYAEGSDLFSAIKNNDINTVKRLIKNGADLNAKKGDGWTALMLAAQEGKTDIVKLLIKSGADLNAKDKYSQTALMVAAFKGETDIAKLLIENGADLNAKNKYSKTALMLAEAKGNAEIIELLKHPEAILASKKESKKESKIKVPPALKLAIKFSEPSGNNILDADETGEIIVTVENSGPGKAYNVKAVVQADKSIKGLSYKKELPIGDILPGKTVTATIRLNTSEDLPSDRAVFTINAIEANGFDSDPVRLAFDTKMFEPPRLLVADVGIEDGNGNLKVEPLENVEVTVRVQNAGYGDARKVSVDIQNGDNVFIGGEGKTHFEIGSLRAGDFKNIKFIFYTNKRIQHGERIPIKVKISEARQRFNSEKALDFVMNATQKSASEIIVKGIESPKEQIEIATGLSVDVDMNIPRGMMAGKDDIAVVIGNKHYSIPSVPQVEFADRDARMVKEYLITTFGFNPNNIIYAEDATFSRFNEIFGTASQPTKSKLYNWIKKDVSKVFIYYTGHGAPDLETGGAYLLPVDADPQYVSINGYSLETLYSNLAQLPAKEVIVVLDACFSGNSENGMLFKGISPAMIKVKKFYTGLPNTTLITSAGMDEVSAWYVEKKHSLFTYYFLKGIRGDADANKDRKITVGEMKSYLTENVSYMARRLKNIEQNPVLLGNTDSTLVVLK